jgi:hypothetical protein
MGRVFIFCFYFQQFKNIAQTSSILLLWQTNNTIVFTLSTGRIVHGTICLECNCTTLKLTSHAEFLLSFSIDQSFKRLSKLVRVTDTLEKLNLAVNLKFFFLIRRGCDFFLYSNKNVPSAEILRGRHCLRTRTFILFGLNMDSYICSL